MSSDEVDQLDALRALLFGAIDQWNTAHPHPLRSHHEHGSLNITQGYSDANGAPSYSITIVCALAGSAPLAFHGHDLRAVTEHARLTLGHRIEAEAAQRAEKARDDAFERAYAGV